MTDQQSRKLETLLGEQLRKGCADTESIGYNPTKFRIMMAESGPVGACQRVIMSARVTDGFTKLWDKDRLELTAEAIILQGPWKALFEPEVLEKARKSLRKYDRPDLAI